MRYMPPLNALRAFCAASRHDSFSRAADEIHVTHGAVSRHIRQLEDILAVQLFHRLPRGVELTAEGKTLAFAVQRAFDEISDAVEIFRRSPNEKVVTISTVPSIAARWLVPRLEAFQRSNPDIEMRISTTIQLVDLDRDGVDFVIRYGRGGWAGLEQELLFSKTMAVVCAPAILDARDRPLKYGDLADYRLIIADGYQYWRAWFRHAGVEEIKPKSVLDVMDANVAIQAALEGQGIAMLPEILVRAELVSGRLVQAFPDTLATEFGYYLAHTERQRLKPHVIAAMDWIRREAASSGKDMDPALLP